MMLCPQDSRLKGPSRNGEEGKNHHKKPFPPLELKVQRWGGLGGSCQEHPATGKGLPIRTVL